MLTARTALKINGFCDKITMKFTTTTTNYDLLNDTNIKAALLNFFSEADFNRYLIDGLPLSITVITDAPTQIKVDAQTFYNDLLEDSTFEITNKIKTLKIKDTGITGTVDIVILK